MNLQITFLERCKALGIADKNLPAWLDEIETLRKQIAELTERLRLSEALRTSDMETTAEQAAQIEMLRDALKTCQLIKINFPDSEQTHQMVFNSKVVFTALTTTPSQALAAFATKVRNEAYEKVAVFCNLQQDEPECPERASYCAEAIRNLKELP